MYSTRLKTITPSRACGMAGCSKLRSISTSDLTKSDGAGTLSLQTCLAQGRKFAAKNFGSQNFRSKWIEMTRNDVNETQLLGIHCIHPKNVPKHKNHKIGTLWRELQGIIVPANVLLSGEATSTFVALALHAPGVELKAAVKPSWIVVSEGSMGRCHLTSQVTKKHLAKR